jgi:hypothetical protein
MSPLRQVSVQREEGWGGLSFSGFSDGSNERDILC